MSQPSLGSASPPSVITKKPQLTVYTMMLIIALISLLIAILFFFLEWQAYDRDSGSQLASIRPGLQQLLPSRWLS